MGSFHAVHKDYVRKASKILFFFPAKHARIVRLDLKDMVLIQIVDGDQLLSFFGLSIHVENNLQLQGANLNFIDLALHIG